MFKEKITLALVDDHPIVIEGLKSIVGMQQEKYNVVCFTDGASVLSFLSANTVHIVLLDMALPDINGIEVCKAIKENYPAVYVIGLSNQAEQSTIMQVLESGGSGFLLKESPAIEILKGIEDVLQGKRVLSQEVYQIIQTPTTPVASLPSLTKREKQLLQLLARGKTTVAVAKELFLSKLTVDTYRKNLLQKFGVKNTSELLMLLVEHKML